MDRSDHQTIERLIQAVDKAYHQPKIIYGRALLVGLLSGLGATLGVAIVLTLMGVLVRILGGIPVISDWLNAVQSNIPNR